MPPRPACARCHEKKIKCNGLPNCRNCANARARCEPHTRARRAFAYNELRERMSWLESEVSSLFGLDCASIATHTALAPLIGPSSQPSIQKSAKSVDSSENQVSSGRDQASSDHPDASDIGMLALNATGELRYLGPSSGSLFFNATSSLLQAGGSNRCDRLHQLGGTRELSEASARHRTVYSGDSITELSPETVKALLSSFKMWIQPLYPLLSDEELSQVEDMAITGSAERQHEEITHPSLVMALGAIHLPHAIKAQQLHDVDLSRIPRASTLYEESVAHFEAKNRDFRPSLSLITTLLLFCIYSSYEPTKDTQWRLAGICMRMAVEMGLHSLNRNRHFSQAEKDRRSRVFWTTYMIETSLSWNLGRPPSLADAHITVESLSATSGSLSLATHHLHHRQIQGQIINTVYATNAANTHCSNEPQNIVQDLQRKLDDWREQLRQLFHQEMMGAAVQGYPMSYWERLHGGTSAVLHRPSPLIPRPLSPSLVKCVTSSGAYIDHLLSTIRNSSTPLTWMLVQGLLFAGLTLLVVVRAHTDEIMREAGGAFLLVSIPTWTRKCSTCLAIIRERWEETLLRKLDSQFEALAEDTLERVAMATMNPHNGTSRANNTAHMAESLPGLPQTMESFEGAHVSSNMAPYTADGIENTGMTQEAPSNMPNSPSQGEIGTFFDDLMGLDSNQDMWNDFMGHSGFDILGAFGDNIYLPSI